MMETYEPKLNTKCKVSVIMPVYKVEAYIGKAIESIQAQKTAGGEPFSDWELLAVDDGSPDQSGAICEQYAAKDKRIRVFHQENSGAPKARNAALPLAQGKYLFFMDSDDYCEPTMLSDLYELAELTAAQLVISGFYIDTYYKLVTKELQIPYLSAEQNGLSAGLAGASSIKKSVPVIDEAQSRYLTANYIPQDAVYETKDAFRRDAYKLFDKNMLYPPWNKLYLRTYIIENQLYFPQTFWDDFPFVLSVIRDVERVAVTSRQYYHFLRARSESETAKYIPKMYEKREEEHQWMIGLYRYWNLWETQKQHDIDCNREMVSRRYIDRLIGCFENLSSPNCRLDYTEKRKRVKEMLESDTVSEALKYAKPRSLYAKLMYLPVRWRSRFWIMREAEVITWVKQHNMRLFAKLKAGR